MPPPTTQPFPGNDENDKSITIKDFELELDTLIGNNNKSNSRFL